MRLLFAALYCLLLTAFVLLNWSKGREARYLATESLAANRLLQPEDLKSATVGNDPAIVGQYLKANVPGGTSISPTDTSILPSFEVKQGSLDIVVRIDRALVTSRTVNAGSEVRLCAEKKNITDPASVKATVKAIVCSGNVPAPCVAVTELPALQVAPVAAAFASAPLPTVHPAGKNCE